MVPGFIQANYVQASASSWEKVHLLITVWFIHEQVCYLTDVWN